MKTAAIQGLKRYEGCDYSGLEDISRLPVYTASRDMKATPV